MYKNINSKYILRLVMTGYLRKKFCFKLLQHNKNIQGILDINLKDYKEYYKRRFLRTEMEIIPISKIEPDVKYFFIKMFENKEYYHIYFDNDNNTQIKRNYITYKDKVEKIKIKIDMEFKSLRGLFSNCTAIKEFKFTKFNRDDFNDITELFYGCENLEKIDLQKFKGPYLRKMNWVFSRCKYLRELNILNFDTSKVTEMINIFSGCYLLNKLEFNFNTENVTNMKGMFCKCKSLTEIDVSKFNTEKVTSFQEMFCECINLNYLNIRKFQLFKKGQQIGEMFKGCKEDLKKVLLNQFSKSKKLNELKALL